MENKGDLKKKYINDILVVVMVFCFVVFVLFLQKYGSSCEKLAFLFLVQVLSLSFLCNKIRKSNF